MLNRVCMGIIVALIGIAATQADDTLYNKPHWRHPISMVSLGDRIYVANQKSGSITVLKTDPLEVAAEILIGEKLSDLKVLGGRWLIAVDEAAHQLLLLEPTADGVRVLHRFDVAKSPVSIAVDASGTRGAVSSLWSWRVTLFEVDEESSKPQLRIQPAIDLPFAPRKMLWLEPENRLIVADAFGGRLAIVDPTAAKVLQEKALAGHNIRGLAKSQDGKDLLVSQQVLSAYSKTEHTPVFWGDLMQNVLRSQSLAELLATEPPKELTGDLFRTEPLGHPSAATGDPDDVQVLPGGQTVVALSGVGEIAIRTADAKPFERFEAQARSTALLLHPDGQRLLIANAFADSITIFHLETWRITEHISLGPTPAELSQEEWGERLFYDARLSLDGWYSCHSCHTDGHTTGHRTDNQSDLSFGAPKRILPLGGTGHTGPWAWNGKAKHLTGQIESSIKHTMQGEPRTSKELVALGSYVLTLQPAPSLDRMRGTLDEAAVSRGERIFRATGCADCHQPPTYTSEQVYDVGLADEVGNTQFNPPSLLGVSQRQELFHDGRGKSLNEAFEKHQHGDAHLLNEKKRADLIAFLRSL